MAPDESAIEAICRRFATRLRGHDRAGVQSLSWVYFEGVVVTTSIAEVVIRRSPRRELQQSYNNINTINTVCRQAPGARLALWDAEVYRKAAVRTDGIRTSLL